MRHADGFTLLELLVVIGVLSVLTGLSIGFLGKSDPKMVADAVLGGELRAARLSARAEGVPTEVLVQPGADGAAAMVQARLLRPVVAFRFEPGQAFEDESLQPALGGEDAPDGRFGHGRRVAPGGKAAVVRWSPPSSLLDLRDGFVVRFDLLLESAGPATLLRLPPAIELTLDAEGRLRARLRVNGVGAGEGRLVPVAAAQPLPRGRWCTIDLGCDSRRCWLAVDGREVGDTIADGAPAQEADGVFEFAPADAAFAGIVDELRWFVYQFAAPQPLPVECEVGKPLRFGFDSRGEATEWHEAVFTTAGGGA
ncbi:MAG: prepilin-type N-terminal cleavage/methylation domain-containing protein [Planctomycetota bacterium]